MKNKKWIIIIPIAIIVIVCAVFIIKNIITEKNKDKALIKVKENMAEKLNNFSYNAVVNIGAYGVKLDVNLNCKEDRVNRLGYCEMQSNVVNLEEYLDYNNKVTYTKTNLLTNDAFQWQKESEKNMTEFTPILGTLDNIIIEKKEKQENGILYTGYIKGKSLSNIFDVINKATSNKFNISSFFRRKIPVTVFVNNDNYVEKVSFSINVLGVDVNSEINFNNFNTTPSISLPEELNGL